MRQSLIDEGIGLSLHVWKNKGKFYLIDGHQRTWALKKMRDEEEFTVPDIPVSFIKAKTYEDAKRRVLIALSLSGKLKEDAFARYVQNNKISLDFLVSHVSPPGINMGDFAEKFMNIKAPDLPKDPGAPEDKMPSSSDQVKQVQLFYNSENHQEFIEKVNSLGEGYGFENISDTVLEAVREAYKSR